jgi:hypothetical protein
MRLPSQLFLACARNGISATRFVLVVSVADQALSLFARTRSSTASRPARSKFETRNTYRFVRAFRCSTSRFGIGQVKGSNCTPLGLHRVTEKIGDGWPVGTVFKSRRAIGLTWKGLPWATVTSRILWLEGLEPGFNRGGKVDSHARYIYIHGTGNEPSLGRPASCGCIHLAAEDLVPLFDRVPTGTLVWIAA